MSTRSECAGRIARMQEKLGAQALHGALISHPIDLYYFAGTRQNGILWIPTRGEAQLLIRKSLSRARAEAAIDQVLPFPSSKEFATILPDEAVKIGMTFDVLPVQQHLFYGKLLPNRELIDISALNRDLRSVKSARELEIMQQGAERLCGVFAEVPAFLREGMREVDVAAEFEMRLRKAGGEGYVRMRAFNQELFLGLAVAGENAAQSGFFDGAVTGRGMSPAAPHGASQALIRRDVPILIDYTGIFDGYILDMTRMFVIGQLSPELAAAFELAQAIQERVAGTMRPGTNCDDVFELAAQMADAGGFGANFMGAPGEQARFVGHGVGLELDEMPVLARGFKVPLQLNQTIAVEPKFVFPGIGVVGIENTFVVTQSGGVRLTTLSDALVQL